MDNELLSQYNFQKILRFWMLQLAKKFLVDLENALLESIDSDWIRGVFCKH